MRASSIVSSGCTFDAGHPAVMAIVNRTPDSFWACNRHVDLDSALAALDEAVARGADIVDVGGVRAGQEGPVVTAREEIERVVPFLAKARDRHPDLVLSLDTWRAEVAREAAQEAGIDLVNDTWAGHDGRLTYDTPITSDVVGWLTEAKAGELLAQIAAL